MAYVCTSLSSFGFLVGSILQWGLSFHDMRTIQECYSYSSEGGKIDNFQHNLYLLVTESYAGENISITSYSKRMDIQ